MHCKRTLPLWWVGSPRQTIWSHWDAQIICVCGCIPRFSPLKASEHVKAFIHLLLLRTRSRPDHAAATTYKMNLSYLYCSKTFLLKTEKNVFVCVSAFINTDHVKSESLGDLFFLSW